MCSKVMLLDDQNFKTEVSDHNGFVLVDFWAEWCGPCKQLVPIIEKLSESIGDKIKICKFDVDSGTEVPSKYGIQSIPTLIIFQNGEEIARKVGLVNDLKGWVDTEIS